MLMDQVDLQPGHKVLVWGAAGGLGSMAVQLVRQFGGLPVAVVSTPDRAEYCRKLGAAGVIDRTGFDHWGPPPDPADGAGVARWLAGARAFRRRLCDLVGERPRVVFEHSGRDTLATSLYVCDNAGMVVLCGATSGYHATVDLRFLWMRQKRLQGSHYANLRQCRELTRLVADGRVDPCLSVTVPFRDTGALHQRMHDNDLPPGNAAVLVNATAEH
jgi:crotonyl-CoA carboxylase/reductase